MAEGRFTEDLKSPPRCAGLIDLARSWVWAELTLEVPGAGHLARRPELVGKLRGAWGEALKESASPAARAGRACDWEPACAFELFMREQGRGPAGLPIPKPYVFAVDERKAALCVRLCCFGLAAAWAGEAAEALVRALRGALSVGRGLEPAFRRIRWCEGVEPPAGDHLLLLFRSPLEIRTRDRGAYGFATFITSLGNRVSGLARWQGATVEADFRALKAEAAALPVAGEAGGLVEWRRFSARQGQWIPMAGRLPAVRIPRPSPELLALLAIGTVTHVGSHAALGLGRYVLVVCEEGGRRGVPRREVIADRVSHR